MAGLGTFVPVRTACPARLAASRLALVPPALEPPVRPAAVPLVLLRVLIRRGGGALPLPSLAPAEFAFEQPGSARECLETAPGSWWLHVGTRRYARVQKIHGADGLDLDFHAVDYRLALWKDTLPSRLPLASCCCNRDIDPKATTKFQSD